MAATRDVIVTVSYLLLPYTYSLIRKGPEGQDNQPSVVHVKIIVMASIAIELQLTKVLRTGVPRSSVLVLKLMGRKDREGR